MKAAFVCAAEGSEQLEFYVLQFNWSKKTRARRCYATCLFAPAEYSHEPITAQSDTWKGSVINLRCLNSDDVRWIRRFNDNAQ